MLDCLDQAIDMQILEHPHLIPAEAIGGVQPKRAKDLGDISLLRQVGGLDGPMGLSIARFDVRTSFLSGNAPQ